LPTFYNIKTQGGILMNKKTFITILVGVLVLGLAAVAYAKGITTNAWDPGDDDPDVGYIQTVEQTA